VDASHPGSVLLLLFAVIVSLIVKQSFLYASYNTCKDRWRITSNVDDSNEDNDSDNEDDNDNNKKTLMK